VGESTLQHVATHYNMLQHTVTCCNTLQHAGWIWLWDVKGCVLIDALWSRLIKWEETHCNALQHAATHCHTLPHTATHCNTLQHTATHWSTLVECSCEVQRKVSLSIRYIGWLWLVGSIKLWVSFAKERYKRNDFLQKRLIIQSILLTVATP